MTHRTAPDFWECYDRLPARTQKLADKNYELLKANPYHPSLHFKPLHGDYWSAGIGRQYRALAIIDEGEYLWFWIGTHAEYDQITG